MVTIAKDCFVQKMDAGLPAPIEKLRAEVAGELFQLTNGLSV